MPYLFALLGIVKGDDPLAQMDEQVEAAHARSNQAHPAARVAQPAADGDLRGPLPTTRRLNEQAHGAEFRRMSP